MTARIDPARTALTAAIGAAALALGLLAGIDPALAIAAAVGIGFVGLVLADLTTGVMLFALLSFLGLLPTLAGPSLSPPKLAGLLLAISWLAVMATRPQDARDLFTDHPAVAALLLTFLAWVGLSGIWAESPSAAATSLYRLLLNLALFPIVYSAIRRREHAFWIAGAYVGGAVIAAAYGFVVKPDVSAASGVGGADALNRVSGTIGDPNELAAALVTGVALATGLVVALKRAPGVRLLAAGGGALCLATIFLTLSRGGLIALAMALVAGIAIGGRWRLAYATVAVAAVVGAGAYYTQVATPAQRQHLTSNDGGTGRTDIWKVGWRMVDRRPLEGFGAGNFPVSSVHYVLQPGTLRRSDLLVEQPQVTHNIYLQLLSELGIVGLALFLAIVAMSIRCALRAASTFKRRGESGLELLTRAVIVGLAGMLAADFFLSGQYSKQLWLLLALCPALMGLAARQVDDALRPTASPG
ncbi:MAG: hypothetical protein QOJ38_558 [Solirubrobacterales bacterium]|nr:hypothetical protein [Solirubrobacterales bacterium]